MTKHLSACPQRRAMIEQAESGKGKSETLYHLRVQAAYQSEFWLDLEMRSSAKLKDLDSYLRAIWLECCGHLSQFSIGGWGGEEISQDRKAKAVFNPGVQLTHIYDFGTSSETLVNVVGMREGKPTTAHPIALMARNLMPEAKCIECDKPAAWLCTECLIEDEVWGTLCDEHARTHPHDNYGEPIPLVNSPRLGMCGYDGPAEPPY
ncbi:MAG: hypothetical protein U1F42_10755 [Candidatus Competibacteraceae bacterium]